MSVVLVVAAHPDDEVLGVGATAARRAAAGDTVHLALLGEGITSRPGTDRTAVGALQDDARAVAGMLGAKSVAFGALPDNRFDTVALLDIVQRVEGWVREVYAFEVASSTEWAFGRLAAPFSPTVFEDAASTIDLKVACLERYRGEHRAFPHPRSGEALRVIARRWGSVVGLAYAEAFELIRSVRS